MATDKKTFPKQQLEIVQVQEVKSYSGGAKFLLPVMAKNLSLDEKDPLRDKPLKYTVFNQELQDHIKPLAVGARFLSDIEERDRPDSEFGPDRNIVQIYVDGKPVSKKAGGGGYRGRTLEEDIILENLKRRSADGQTAITQVGLALTCPTPIPGEDLGIDEEDWSRIVGKYWQAVEKSLDNFLAEPTGGPMPEARQRPQDKQENADKPAAVSKDPPPPSGKVQHVGDFMTRCKNMDPPLSRTDICTIFSVKDPAEIPDLDAAWAEILKKYPAAVAADKAAAGKGA